MKKSLRIALACLVLAACSKAPAPDGSQFAGDWELSESSPMYAQLKGTTIHISKSDTLFVVEMKKDGKDPLENMPGKDKQDPETRKKMEDGNKYKLGTDKLTLISMLYADNSTPALTYHADTKILESGTLLFKKK